MPSYTPRGVCSRRIDFEIDEAGLIHDVHFAKGCPGNLLGICRLVEGRPAEEIIALFSGLPCGDKSTSCPDQLAQALQEELARR